jgi:hypothetical protein
MIYFIHNIFTNVFREVFWPKHVGENIVNKIHHRILKCIKCILLVIFIYIWIWLMHGWWNIFLISYSLLTLHIVNAVSKMPIIFPYFPDMCIPVLTNIFLWFFPVARIFTQYGFEVLEGTSSLRLSAYARTQSRVVIGLLAGHNSLRRHLYVMGLGDNPTCRKLRYWWGNISPLFV